MNTKVNQKETLEESNPVLQKVASILGISQKEMPKLESTKKTILAILSDKRYQGEKELFLYLIQLDSSYYREIQDSKLKQDRDILLATLRKDPEMFVCFPEKQKTKSFFLEEAIRAFVRQGRNFVEIEDFIESQKIKAEQKEKLFTFYRQHLKDISYVFSSDIEKYFLYFQEFFPEFYSLLKGKKIFEQRNKRWEISEKWQKIFEELFTQTNSKNPKEKNTPFLALKRLFQISETQNDEQILSFFTFLERCFHNQVQNAQAEVSQEGEDERDNISQKKEESQEDFLYTGSYTFTSRSGGKVSFDYGYGKKIDISEEDVRMMTSQALENYIGFLELFDSLGLSFLSRKYQQQFFRIGEVNHLRGEGITEGKILKLLNLIGKNIGVPEENYEDEEGKRKTSCFQTLAGARLAFQDIKSTGKIQRELVCEPSRRGDHSIVEIYMMTHGLLDREGKGIMSYKWK